jgi:hypothetical protein
MIHTLCARASLRSRRKGGFQIINYQFPTTVHYTVFYHLIATNNTKSNGEWSIFVGLSPSMAKRLAIL